MVKNKNIKGRVLKHLGNVGMAIITVTLMTPSSLAIDSTEAASQVIGAEGGKKLGKEALWLGVNLL